MSFLQLKIYKRRLARKSILHQTSLEVYSTTHFFGSLLYSTLLWKSSFVNIGLLFFLKKSWKYQRKFPCKSSGINMLVLQLIELCQKFDFFQISKTLTRKSSTRKIKINILFLLEDFHVSRLRLLLQLKNKT